MNALSRSQRGDFGAYCLASISDHWAQTGPPAIVEILGDAPAFLDRDKTPDSDVFLTVRK